MAKRLRLTEALTRALFGSPAPGLSTLFDAALLFIRGQYLLTWPEKGGTYQQKYLSAQSVRQALLLEELDLCLPNGIRRYGSSPMGEWFLQVRPAGRASLLLQADGQPGGQLVQVALPSLVFYGHQTHYFVWAIKDEELTPETLFYQAPLPNVSPDGAICFGLNQPPRATLATVEQAWEIFITSPFNSHHADGKSRRFPKNVQQQLRSLARRRWRHYPASDLVPLRDGDITLTKLLEMLAEHRRRSK